MSENQFMASDDETLAPDSVEGEDLLQQICFSQEETDQSSTSSPKKKRSRRLTKCHDIIVKRNTEKLSVTIDSFGNPLGEHKAKCASFIGVLIRTCISINMRDWRLVPIETKEKMWAELKKCIMGNIFRGSKSIHSQYVKNMYKNDPQNVLKIPEKYKDTISQEDWNEFVGVRSTKKWADISMQNSANKGKDEYYTYLGRGGYTKYKEDNDMQNAERHVLWRGARKHRNGAQVKGDGVSSYRQAKAFEVSKEIDDLLSKIADGKEVLGENEDVLQRVLKNKPHPARLLTGDIVATQSDKFPNKSRKAKSVALDVERDKRKVTEDERNAAVDELVLLRQQLDEEKSKRKKADEELASEDELVLLRRQLDEEKSKKKKAEEELASEAELVLLRRQLDEEKTKRKNVEEQLASQCNGPIVQSEKTIVVPVVNTATFAQAVVPDNVAGFSIEKKKKHVTVDRFFDQDPDNNAPNFLFENGPVALEMSNFHPICEIYSHMQENDCEYRKNQVNFGGAGPGGCSSGTQPFSVVADGGAGDGGATAGMVKAQQLVRRNVELNVPVCLNKKVDQIMPEETNTHGVENRGSLKASDNEAGNSDSLLKFAGEAQNHSIGMLEDNNKGDSAPDLVPKHDSVMVHCSVLEKFQTPILTPCDNPTCKAHCPSTPVHGHISLLKKTQLETNTHGAENGGLLKANDNEAEISGTVEDIVPMQSYEIPGLELEARIIKLERIFTELEKE